MLPSSGVAVPLGHTHPPDITITSIYVEKRECRLCGPAYKYKLRKHARGIASHKLAKVAIKMASFLVDP